jgi:hypothetical protein
VFVPVIVTAVSIDSTPLTTFLIDHPVTVPPLVCETVNVPAPVVVSNDCAPGVVSTGSLSAVRSKLTLDPPVKKLFSALTVRDTCENIVPVGILIEYDAGSSVTTILVGKFDGFVQVGAGDVPPLFVTTTVVSTLVVSITRLPGFTRFGG